MRRQNGSLAIPCALAACILAAASMNVQAAPERWESTVSRDENNDICIDFEEVQVLLPADWSGKCQMVVSEDDVSFYQKKSRELYTAELGYPAGGFLFSINFTQDFDFLDLPSYQTIGVGEDGVYYAEFPTDVQGYMNDEAAFSEFREMNDDMAWVRENITLTGESASSGTDMTDEYILPQSSTQYLTEADLAGMDADLVQMAINEIYARHHRKFVLEEVQEYFDSRSWYDGYIEANDFDVSVMNEYESYNINLMVTYMEKLNNVQTIQ